MTARRKSDHAVADAMPGVTVLMPAYNAADFLEASLQSVLTQSFSDFELLVIDDGSRDATPRILDACRDPRLRVIRNPERLKLSGALNRGLDQARGRLVARMDADDRMHPDRLARQVEYFERFPHIGCCGGWVRTFGDGRRRTMTYPSGPARVKAFSLFYAPFAHPTVMFRNEWFTSRRLRYDGAYYPAEDYELWSRALSCFPGDNLPRILGDYRVHPNSMTGGEWSAMDAQTVRIHRQILKQLDIDPTPAQSRCHRQASMGLVPPSPDAFDVTETWLATLADANRRHGVYDATALAEILQDVWFRTAMGLVRSMPRATWIAYRRSRLAGVGVRSRIRRWTLWMAALKAFLLKGGR